MVAKTERPAVNVRLVSVVEAAQMLSIGETGCRELIARHELESITIGARRLVPVAAIDSFIERRLQEAAS